MKHLDTFIAKYVLCRFCENPETIFKATASKITLTCKACGKTTEIIPIDRFENMVTKAAAAKSAKAKTKKAAAAAAAAAGSDDSAAASAAAAPAAATGEKKVVKKKVVKKKVVKKNLSEAAFQANLPVYAIESEICAALPSLGVNPSAEKVGEALRKIYDALGEHRNCEHMVRAAYSTLFNGAVAEKIVALGDVLAQFTAARKNVQVAVLELLEESVKEREVEEKNVPGLLKKFFDGDVLEEENILAWTEENKESVLTKAAEPFTTWLKTAEIEE